MKFLGVFRERCQRRFAVHSDFHEFGRVGAKSLTSAQGFSFRRRVLNTMLNSKDAANGSQCLELNRSRKSQVGNHHGFAAKRPNTGAQGNALGQTCL